MTTAAEAKGRWRAPWRGRAQRAVAERTADERAFLPAALELVETPPSPAARGLLWAILVFLALALLWSVLGQLDIVAVARGKVVPSGRVKVVQPLERAMVRRLLVRDGMAVAQGQLLIELDATELGAEAEKVAAARADAALAVARARALLAVAARERAAVPRLAPLPGVAAARLDDANRLLAAEFVAYRTELLARDAEAAHLRAQRATLQASVSRLEALLPLREQRAADLGRLAGQHFVARHDYLEAENLRLDTAGELAVQRQRLGELDALERQQRERQGALVADFQRRTREALQQAGQQLAQLEQEAVKLEARRRHMALRAPVAGTVQQLAVHTEGGVVTEAQPLLVIVPADDALEVEAMVENRDIGFVRAGQAAQVKVDAFPFTRHGMLQGRVLHLAPDAVPDGQRGLFYPARVRLERPWLAVEGRPVALVPGMAVSVEIRTGRRRVIDYFLSPLLQHGAESVRER